MGAKIEFCYLSDNSNKSILMDAMKVLYDIGWTYNKHVKGGYTYWIDGPIWNFGDSKTYIETDCSIEMNFQYIEKAIEQISQYYSQAIVIGTSWEGIIIEAIISIFENETNWKEVKFSIDRYNTLDLMNFSQKPIILEKLKKVFLELGLRIKPYYGIGATEVSGLVSSPDMLINDYCALGDLNYFSQVSTEKFDVEKLKMDFNVEVLENGAWFVYCKDELFKLG
ncbi:hypothetical protein [Clostridium thailandense]|uniref:hypothetical protein n=1 Tax=Clostridium thailandense TaxID=2794346 RepID=UPI003989C34F